MTTSNPNGRADPDAAERLSVAWDDLVTDRPTETDDEGLVTVARQLNASTNATDFRERPGFRQDLRDTLMQSPTIAMPIPGGLSRHRIDPAPSHPIAVGTVTMLRRTGGRWLSLAATFALLLATAAGGYLASVGLPGNDGRPTNVAGFQGATPKPDATPAATDSSFECGFADNESFSSPYLPCVELQEAFASTEVRGTFSTAAKAASMVQMQTWTFDGGASVSFRAPTSLVAGVAVDFVLDGAYVATFDDDVTVTPAYVPRVMIPMYTPVAAGEPVELTGGDLVSYEIGTRRTVSNPLSGSPLTLKTVLIHDGDPSPGDLVEGSEGPPVFSATVDGDGTLPMTVGEYGPLGPVLLLNHVRLFGDYPFPSEVGGFRVVMGPVAGSVDPTEMNGWVLWASTFVATA